MMKKVAGILLLVCVCDALQAQVLIAIIFGDKLNTDKLEFGLVLSPGLMNITNMGGSYKTGLNLGLYFTYKVNDRWFLHPELIAKGSFGSEGVAPYPTGSDSLDRLFSGGSVTRRVQSFSMPLLVHYRVYKRWFAEAGVQTDLALKAKDEFMNPVGGNPLSYTTTVTSSFNRIDFGVTAGLVYKITSDRGMGMGIRYYYGLTDVLKDLSGVQMNSVWLVNVFIPIGSGNSGAGKGGGHAGGK
jgi:hypothetical protein